ncbi:hypothetical protein DKU74_13230 [Salmonella enterica subsp. salamae]|nr:hypothetical protein [Salmonella enterica subsp. salamae]
MAETSIRDRTAEWYFLDPLNCLSLTWRYDPPHISGK